MHAVPIRSPSAAATIAVTMTSIFRPDGAAQKVRRRADAPRPAHPRARVRPPRHPRPPPAPADPQAAPAPGEIDKIIARLGDAGVTLVPLSLYFQDGWAKVEIALARGRRSFDKRQAIARRDADREIARELSDRLRGRRRRGRGPRRLAGISDPSGGQSCDARQPSTLSMSTAPGEWLVLVSGRDHRLAWPTGAPLSANNHAIQQQFAAPDTPGFATLKRTIQAGGPSLTAGADPPGQRDATGIVGEEQPGCHAARQSLVGDAGPQRRSAASATSSWLAVRQAGCHGVSVAHGVPLRPLPGAASGRGT
jgi:SmpB protein